MDRCAGGVQAAFGRVRRFGVGAAVAAWALGFALPVGAQEVECATIRWNAAPGPVVGYEIFVEIDGGDMRLYDRIETTQASIGGPEFQVGDALRFQIRAYAADGRVGPASALSGTIFCQTVPTPQGVGSEDGSLRNPNLIWWDPVEYAEFYAIFRSSEPGAAGSFLARSDDPWFEDADAEVGSTYEYVVAAVAGRQVSAFTPPVTATRRGSQPQLVASETALRYTAQSNQTTAEQTVELSNAGDGQISYQAWSGARWLQLSPLTGTVSGDAQTLTLRYDLQSLESGEHATTILIYGYYDPLPGEEFVLPPPIAIRVELSIPPRNQAPVFDSPLDFVVTEGRTIAVPIGASDPDPDDLIDIGVGGGLPPWAVFENFGGGQGQLVLSPDFEAAGSYSGLAAVWDNGSPAAYTVEPISITVRSANRAPEAATVPDQTVQVGQKRTIVLSAIDPDGDRVAFTSSQLPDFMRFSDLGNGTAELVVEPQPAHLGSYLVVFAVVDDGSPPGFTGLSVRITVVE